MIPRRRHWGISEPPFSLVENVPMATRAICMSFDTHKAPFDKHRTVVENVPMATTAICVSNDGRQDLARGRRQPGDWRQNWLMDGKTLLVAGISLLLDGKTLLLAGVSLVMGGINYCATVNR